MPSEALVMVPSLRGSAASFAWLCRVLIISLISDGLSWLVAITSFPDSNVCGAMRAVCLKPGLGTGNWGLGKATAKVQSKIWQVCRPESRVPALLRQRGTEPRPLGTNRALDDPVAGSAYRAADQCRD